MSVFLETCRGARKTALYDTGFSNEHKGLVEEATDALTREVEAMDAVGGIVMIHRFSPSLSLSLSLYVCVCV